MKGCRKDRARMPILKFLYDIKINKIIMSPCRTGLLPEENHYHSSCYLFFLLIITWPPVISLL